MASVDVLKKIFHLHTDFFMATQQNLWCAAKMRGSRMGYQEVAIELLEYHKELGRANKSEDPVAVTRIENSRHRPSTRPLESLNPMLLINLVLDLPNKGYFVKLRTISNAIQRHGIIAIAEDENHNYTILFLNHHYDSDDATGILPKESIVLIKEPFYTCTYEGRRCIKVDHPSDIIQLLDRDPRIPCKWRKTTNSVEWYNSAGVKAFNDWQYFKSLRMHNNALSFNHVTSKARSTRQYRVAVYLELRCFDAVLEDFRHLQRYNSLDEPTILCAIEATYQLQRYEACRSYLAVLKRSFPANTQYSAWACKVCRRLEEKAHGTYDFAFLCKHPPTADWPYLDLATYVGPITRRDTNSRGRGLFATKSVKAGHLLLCEKAISAIMPSSCLVEKQGFFLVGDQGTVLTTSPASFAIRTDIVQKLMRNPSLRVGFEELYDGGYRERVYNGRYSKATHAVDAWLVDQIVGKNSFASYANSREEHVWAAQTIYAPGSTMPREIRSGSGVWVQMSFMNHACVPNVHASYHGEMLIVRAARDIAKDEELFINYCPFGDFSSRQQILGHWDFKCDCRACVEEVRTTNEQRDDRVTLGKSLEDILASIVEKHTAFASDTRSRPSTSQDPESPTVTSTVKEIEDLLTSLHKELEKFDNTFCVPANIVPHYETGRHLLNIAYFYFRQERWSECKASALRALSALGFRIHPRSGRVMRWGVMSDSTVIMAALLWKAGRELQDLASEQMKTVAKTAYEIVVGESVSFEETYWWLDGVQDDEDEEEEVDGYNAAEGKAEKGDDDGTVEAQAQENRGAEAVIEIMEASLMKMDLEAFNRYCDLVAEHAEKDDGPKKRTKAKNTKERADLDAWGDFGKAQGGGKANGLMAARNGNGAVDLGEDRDVTVDGGEQATEEKKKKKRKKRCKRKKKGKGKDDGGEGANQGEDGNGTVEQEG